MSQAFSLYNELTVRQNLELHARLFHIPEAEIPARVAEMSERFKLNDVEDILPESLPLGIRQRSFAGGGGDSSPGDVNPR